MINIKVQTTLKYPPTPHQNRSNQNHQQPTKIGLGRDAGGHRGGHEACDRTAWETRKIFQVALSCPLVADLLQRVNYCGLLIYIKQKKVLTAIKEAIMITLHTGCNQANVSRN